MTNTQKGMTLEQSMWGKHISGCMFSLCLETQIQIKVKTTVPLGAIALESKTDKSASREKRVVNLTGAFKQCLVQS